MKGSISVYGIVITAGLLWALVMIIQTATKWANG